MVRERQTGCCYLGPHAAATPLSAATGSRYTAELARWRSSKSEAHEEAKRQIERDARYNDDVRDTVRGRSVHTLHRDAVGSRVAQLHASTFVLKRVSMLNVKHDARSEAAKYEEAFMRIQTETGLVTVNDIVQQCVLACMAAE